MKKTGFKSIQKRVKKNKQPNQMTLVKTQNILNSAEDIMIKLLLRKNRKLLKLKSKNQMKKSF